MNPPNSNPTEAGKYVSFAAFFLMWAEVQGWQVPGIHIIICNWMEHRGRLAVLEVFRGCGKSTILAVYNAWCYYTKPTYRILHQGDQDDTAYKTSRDTKNVLMKHPLTKRTIGYQLRGEVSFWWTSNGYEYDPRNPSMQAAGILSNITSSRADEVQNDDVEVQKNVETPEAREKLRKRLGEQIHIAVPGAKRLFVGTPHTHDSLYDDLAASGADVLKIPLFGKEQRFGEKDRETGQTEFQCRFLPDLVFVGIGKHTTVAVEGEHFTRSGTTLRFHVAPVGTIDCYADNAWPERFTLEEMVERRKQCRTLNEWDSQYQLHAKPIVDVRLDPVRIIPYDVTPVLRMANRRVVMMLANVQIVGVSAYWDCSLGKLTSDASAFTVLLTDEAGRLYMQVCEALEGNIDDQCRRIRELVVQYQIPRVEVETNGPGGFVPPILRKHLKKTGCGVGEVWNTTNKNKRILDAWEAPLDSGFLWSHIDVLNGPLWDQMMEWNPAVKEQPDDYLDSGAGAIASTPVRIGKVVGNPTDGETHNWRPNHGQFDVIVERN